MGERMLESVGGNCASWFYHKADFEDTCQKLLCWNLGNSVISSDCTSPCLRSRSFLTIWQGYPFAGSLGLMVSSSCLLYVLNLQMLESEPHLSMHHKHQNPTEEESRLHTLVMKWCGDLHVVVVRLDLVIIAHPQELQPHFSRAYVRMGKVLKKKCQVDVC